MCFTVAGIAVPVSSGASTQPQPSAIERLIRQEDARWPDSQIVGERSLGLTGDSPLTRAVRSPASEKLAAAIQTAIDARRNDPRLGDASVGRRASGPTPARVAAADGFAWLPVALGAFAGLAVGLVGAGVAFLAGGSRAARA